jgi:arylamine N-acetyltransferase
VTSTWARRYLDHLQLEEGLPNLEWLQRFGEAHLRNVPFENVTSLLRRLLVQDDGPVPPLDLDQLLDNWEHGEGGGVCFEVATMVANLLPQLGYDAYPILGAITFPASHHAVVVNLPEGPHMVDLGCGAPLSTPIPLDRVSEYERAGLHYRFRPDLTTMTCVQDRMIEGQWTPFCHYDLRPADPELREAGYQRHNTPGESWVVGSIVLVSYLENGNIAQIRDGRFTLHTPTGKHSRPITSRLDYMRTVRDDLHLPNLPIGLGLEALEQITGDEV